MSGGSSIREAGRLTAIGTLALIQKRFGNGGKVRLKLLWWNLWEKNEETVIDK